MLREPHFYVGLAAGAVVAWLLARGRGQLVAATPYTVRPIRRTPQRVRDEANSLALNWSTENARKRLGSYGRSWGRT